MGYDSQLCIKDIQDVIPGGTPCEGIAGYPYHCDTLYTASQYYHNYCAERDMYAPIQLYYCHNSNPSATPPIDLFDIPENIGKKCMNKIKNQSGADNWDLAVCYCCCACMAGGTLIAMLEGEKAIRNIQEGDEVLALTFSGQDMEWKAAIVDFSQGSGDVGEQPLMVYIAFGPDGAQDFICTMDQPLLLADKTLTIAAKLRPGQQLMGRDGQPVDVRLVSFGAYKGDVHHIGVGTAWEGKADRHLICASGIVAGDWDLQMHFNELPDSQKEAGFHSLPLIGTPEYEKRYSSSLQKSEVAFEFSVKGRDFTGKAKPNTFKAYYSSSALLPANAQKLLTDDQAADLLKNGEQTSFSNPVPLSIFNTIVAQMKGFFPDIDFYYEHTAVMPNVYAFEAYGRKVVLVNGGFGRMKGIGYEGMFLAMAQGVARFSGMAPLDNDGYTAVGQADGIAFGVISRLCWVGDGLLTYVMNGFKIWRKLFSAIDPAHAGGSHPVNDPSIECRLDNILSAIGGGSLLECAGGEPRPRIALEEATPSANGTGADLVFSLPLEPESAEDPDNYVFTPAATVISAKRDDKQFIVHLEAKLNPKLTYTVTAKDLVSIYETGMDPQHSTVPVTFRLPDGDYRK